MEDKDLERRLDAIENSFIRFEGKVDLINHQLEAAAALTVERSGNMSAAVGLNQAAIRSLAEKYELLNDQIPVGLAKDLRELQDWKRDIKTYGRTTMFILTALGSVGGSVITWAIIDALTKKGH